MDDRQTQIREGAGLEDSRVNQEFIDFLNKWSSPVLLTLAVAALIWAGLQYLERKEIARIDQAFSELSSATQGGNPSPPSLKALAAEYKGVRSVSELALLTTTDLYLNAFVIGVKPGAERNPQTGLPINEDDSLNDTQRQVYLEDAGKLAQQVLDSTVSVKGKELITMQAMSRLAAVEEGKRNFDGAKSMYQRLETLASESNFGSVASFAQHRIENLASLQDEAELPSQEAFVPLPGEENLLSQDSPVLSPEQMQELLDSIQDAGSDAAPDAQDLNPDSVPEANTETGTEADPADEPESP